MNRIWRDAGHDVHYVQNVTDVDDPLFERANRDGEDWIVLGMRETALFREDMEALRVLPPKDYIGAVESVNEVVELVEKFVASGAAYIVDDAEFPDVYFRADATEQFGYESGYDRATMEKFFAERGGDPDRVGKRNPLDALVWRAERPGEPSWPSPFGPGRPGWHIECAAIALNRIGSGFDVQGGGSDLIFPHHEFSAAHAESATGDRRFARHYVHTGMIGLDGEKMSKSRGNLVFVSKLRGEGVDPAAIPSRTSVRPLPPGSRVDRSGPRGCSVAPEGVARGSSSRFCAVCHRHCCAFASAPGRRSRHPEGRSTRSTVGPAAPSRAADPTRRHPASSPMPSTPYWVFRFAEPLLCAFINRPRLIKAHSSF